MRTDCFGRIGPRSRFPLKFAFQGSPCGTRALVLLKWRLDGQGFSVRRLQAVEALAHVPFIDKALGVFDVDRPPVGGEQVADKLPRYADLLGRVVVVEVSGKVDVPALVDVVGDLLP